MAGTVVHEDVFEKAQDRAREERLKKALEYEMAAHRSLCQHYNSAIEKIAELEEKESADHTRLEETLGQKLDENLALRRNLETYKSIQRLLLAVIAVAVAAAFMLANDFI